MGVVSGGKCPQRRRANPKHKHLKLPREERHHREAEQRRAAASRIHREAGRGTFARSREG